MKGKPKPIRATMVSPLMSRQVKDENQVRVGGPPELQTLLVADSSERNEAARGGSIAGRFPT